MRNQLRRPFLDPLGQKESKSSCSIASENNGLAKSQTRMGLRSKIGPVSEETYQLIVETPCKIDTQVTGGFGAGLL